MFLNTEINSLFSDRREKYKLAKQSLKQFRLVIVGDKGNLFLIYPSYPIPPNTKVTSTSNGSPDGWKYRNLSKPVFLIVPFWKSLRK